MIIRTVINWTKDVKYMHHGETNKSTPPTKKNEEKS